MHPVRHNHYYQISADTLLHKQLGNAGIKKIEIEMIGEMPETHKQLLKINARGKLIEEEFCASSCRGKKFNYDAKGRLTEQIDYDNGILPKPGNEQAIALFRKQIESVPEGQKAYYEQILAELSEPPKPSSRNKILYPTFSSDTVTIGTVESYIRNQQGYTWCMAERKATWQTLDTTFMATYLPPPNSTGNTCDGSSLVLTRLQKSFPAGPCTRIDNLYYDGNGKIGNFQLSYECRTNGRLLESGQFDLTPLKLKIEQQFPETAQTGKWEENLQEYTTFIWDWERRNMDLIYHMSLPLKFERKYAGFYQYDKSGLLTGIDYWDGRKMEITRFPNGRIKEWANSENGLLNFKTSIVYNAKNLPVEITETAKDNKLRWRGKVIYPVN